MTTVEILRKAKAELEQRGWCQGYFLPLEVDPVWSDEEGRTLAHILAAFDRAIALASQPQGPGDGNG